MPWHTMYVEISSRYERRDGIAVQVARRHEDTESGTSVTTLLQNFVLCM